MINLINEKETTLVVVVNECRETTVREAEGIGDGELDHHAVGTTGDGTREDEVRGGGDEDAQEEEKGPEDHYNRWCLGSAARNTPFDFDPHRAIGARGFSIFVSLSRGLPPILIPESPCRGTAWRSTPGDAMKGLFKSKPRTPADIVRHTRELLIYVDLNSNSRDTKREEKVNDPIAMPCSYPSLCFLRHLF
ncbi:hypothetical protein BHM03_00050831, partial [Ensete ventricosum]